MTLFLLLVVYSIWPLIMRGCPADAKIPSELSDGDTVINKNIFSDNMRLLFTLGVEGAGHHYMGAAIDRMYQDSSDLVPLIRCNLSRPYDLRAWALGESRYVMEKNTAKAEMRELALAAHTLPPFGGLATMQGCGPEGWRSWLSYPNFPGPDKALQYLDLRMLASVAEAENIDLRIVYLKRDAKEVIVSSTRHRHFHRTNRRWRTPGGTPQTDFERYIRIMLTDIGVIHSMLAEIGSSFVVCHDYARVGDPIQAELIANFVAPTKYMASALTRSLVDTAKHPDQSEELGWEHGEALVDRLQLKLDLIETSLC